VETAFKEDGNGIGLFARGAPGHPYPDRIRAVRIRYQLGNDLRLKRSERLRVAKEPRNADEQLAKQQVSLVRQSP
jgi:hypothetical protein